MKPKTIRGPGLFISQFIGRSRPSTTLDGDGQIDFRGIFDRLTRYDYEGWAVLDCECCLKNSNDGAREGARFIDEHIIRLSERSFDAALEVSMSPEKLDRVLGIRRN
jgi:hypothetical protein